MKTKVLQVIVLLIIVVLCVLLYKNVAQPVLQASERAKRYEAVKQQLLKLRIVQATWRLKNSRYCSSFDSLAQFIETGVVPIGETSQKQYVPVRAYLKSLKVVINSADIANIAFVDSAKIVLESGVSPEGEPWVEMWASNDLILKDFSTDFIMQSNEELELKTGFAGLRMGNRYDQRPLQASWE